MLTGILTRNPRRRVAALRIPPAAETIGKLIQSGVSTGGLAIDRLGKKASVDSVGTNINKVHALSCSPIQ